MAPPGRYNCDECGKTYGTVGHLNRHMRIHTGERPYKCTQCRKSFMRKDHLDDHRFAHTSERPFPCTRCEMRFYTKQKLNRHEALHARLKRYVCEDCSEAFLKKNQLARHRVQHTGKHPFPCPEPDCEQGFSMPSALRRHQEHRHSLSTYVCIHSGCKAEPFAKFSQLQRHLKVHQPTHPHECDKCGKRFRSASILKKHELTHELPVADRLVHKCRYPGCDAAYTSSGNLGTHVRSQHLNREAFVCETCNARFSIKSSYERHLRNLHGEDAHRVEPKFFCRVCRMGFAARAALRRHVRLEHNMPAHHRDEDGHRVSGDRSGSVVYNKEGNKDGNKEENKEGNKEENKDGNKQGSLYVCMYGTIWIPPTPTEDVGRAGACDRSKEDDAPSSEGVRQATGISTARKRKRKREARQSDDLVEGGRERQDIANDNIINFENDFTRKRRSAEVPSEEHGLPVVNPGPAIDTDSGAGPKELFAAVGREGPFSVPPTSDPDTDFEARSRARTVSA